MHRQTITTEEHLEEYLKDSGFRMADKHDRKLKQFDADDMTCFAEDFARKFLEDEIKSLKEKGYKMNRHKSSNRRRTIGIGYVRACKELIEKLNEL